MKVVRVGTKVLAIPNKEPYYWAGGCNLGINSVIVEVETDEGIVGIGEACGDRSVEAIVGIVRSAESVLVGESVFDVESFLRRFYKQAKWDDMRRFAHQAVAGVEMAMWDAIGKACNQPVHRLLGGALNPTLNHFGFLQGDEPKKLADDATKLVEAGFDVLYMKVGRGRARDIACVGAVRAAVGGDTRLRVDVNQAWQVAEAIQMLQRLAEFDIDFVEQPVHWPDLDGMARIRAAVPMPIAIDQGCFTDYEALSIIEHRAADVLVVGLHETGGLLGLKKVAAVAEAGGLPVCNHGTSGDTGITTLANLQVFATIGNQTAGHQVMHQLLEQDVIVEGTLTFEGGNLTVPERPGLGIELDTDAVERYARHYEKEGPYYNF